MSEFKQIGRYKIKREIGRGGMATVYLAHDPRFGRDVAIKVLPRQFTHDPMFRARFDQEARTIAALDHSTIVPVYDFGEEDSQPYLVMRYMPGGSLSERLEKGLLPLMQVVKILDRVAAALDRAHSMGIIHRDLKPGNILFDQYDDAFLADFGIAKMAEATAALTGSAIIGTPAYMSPEQVRGQKVDGRSDIYTLGVILFELLTGQQPFESDTPMGMAFKHVHEPTPHLTDTKEDLPPELDMTINQAMSKEADKRFSTAGDLAKSVRVNVQQTPHVVPDESVTKPSVPTGFLPSSEIVKPTEVLSEEEIVESLPPKLKSITPEPSPPLKEEIIASGQPHALVQDKTGSKERGFSWWWVITAVVAIGLLIFAGMSLFSEPDTSTTSDEPVATLQSEPASTSTNSAANFIQEKWDQDFRVTDFGYGNDLWVVNMSQDSPYGRQTWETKEEFPKTFIQTKWDEGFRVTDMAYGNGIWAVNMSQGSPYGRQTWETKEAFPKTFIQSKWDENFRVTNIAYGNGVWAVVMSQGSPYGLQTWETKEEFPKTFIQTKWDEGFRVTSLAYGNGVWSV
ncbi:MAG: protein kinase, partial [Chloroflexi bacterium]|nr:protein kinase [Chloroflexota bacterium]